MNLWQLLRFNLAARWAEWQSARRETYGLRVPGWLGALASEVKREKV